MTQLIKIHAVIGDELKTLLVVGGFTAHETQVPGTVNGPDGNPCMTTKVLLHLNCGMKIVVEESLEDLERIYNGEQN